MNLRRELEKSRSLENLIALKNLIQNDIIGSIEDNLRLNNITIDDARKLKRLTHKLYEHIYSHYDEMEVLNDMTDESLMLDIDYIEKEYEEKIDAVKRNLESTKQRLEDAEQKLENTEQKLENAEQKLENTEQKLENTEQKLENTEQERIYAEQRLKSAEQERDAMQAEISRLKALLKENGLL